jgi:formate dehydrogenase major subunit
MELSRRGFVKLTGASLMASTVGALGFGLSGEALAASVRPFKLSATTETRNTCTYCSVACGILIYSMGDRAKNALSNIIHIEGDPDHPVNRGTLCPKGAGLLDIVHAPTRLRVPKYRAPGGSEFKPVSWDFALDRIARLMKQDRDAHFVAKNAAGTTVNRWTSTGMLAA